MSQCSCSSVRMSFYGSKKLIRRSSLAGFSTYECLCFTKQSQHIREFSAEAGLLGSAWVVSGVSPFMVDLPFAIGTSSALLLTR